MNEELKRTEFDHAFCKKFKPLLNRFSSFFAKGRILVEKMINQKKTGVTVRPRSLNPGKAIAMGICPIICSFYYLAHALMLDVACEFACAVGCAEIISANILKSVSNYGPK